MPLDLDRVEALAQDGVDLCNRTDVDVAYTVPDQDVLALLAELRAARATRDEIDRLYEDDRIHLDENERLLRLLAAWDEATKET